jgi:hypothetical protein
MDKQALKKHHFWILLALSVILIPVVLGGTVFGVGSAAVEAKSKIDKRFKELNDAAPKCQQYLDNLDKHKAELVQRRDKIWKEVYDAQAGLFHWPNRLAHLENLYFGDKIAENDRAVFREDGVYHDEYRRLVPIIEPTQFLEKDWSRVLYQHVPQFSKLPSSEDCWLALENLCVQKEVLSDIHAVNQMLAAFLPVPQSVADTASQEDKAKYAADKAKVDAELRESLKIKDDEAFGRFISPYWILDLAVARSTTGKAGELVFRGKLTNISERRQNVAKIDFLVWLTDRTRQPEVPPAVVPVQSEFLAAGESITFDDVRVTAASRANKIFAVEQKLDLRYAPVKRVDRLVLGYLPNRYADQRLLEPEGPAFKEAKESEGGGAAAADPTIPSNRPETGFGPTSQAGGASVRSSHGLERQRYLHRTEQVRRMPIAVVLVVDQSHVQDVQRAFANSRLRFQNVQIHWQRFRGTLDLSSSSSPSLTTQGPRGDSDANPVAGGSGRGGSAGGVDSIGGMPDPRGQPPSGRGAPRFRPPVGPGGAPQPGASGVPPGMQPPGGVPREESMASLVEMTIYGIASLYERYPPKTPQTPGTDATAAAPAQAVAPKPAEVPATPASGGPPPPPPPPPAPPPSPPDGTR